MTSTRAWLPGTNFWPEGPTPFTRPKLAPFLAVQRGPSGPSTTKGMRSFIACGASATNRSGGIHGKSRWQSAEILRYCMVPPRGCPSIDRLSVEPQIRDVARVGLERPALDPLHDVGERLMGTGGNADLLALGDDQAVQELDLGAPALHHILAHRGPLLGGEMLGAGEHLVRCRAERRSVALAGQRHRLRRQMQHVLERVAQGLADADRFATEPQHEAADGLVPDAGIAAKPGAGGKPVAHDVG